MARSSSKKTVKLTYLQLLDTSILHPNKYSFFISEFSNSKEALIFFISNFSFGFLIRILATVLVNKNLNFFFLGIDSLFLGIPFTLMILLVLVLMFFVISKILGGKSSLKQTFITSSYCSTPFVILLWVPILSIVSLLFSVYLLIISFQKIHQYSLIKAIVTIAIPFMGAILFLELLGLIRPILGLIISLPIS